MKKYYLAITIFLLIITAIIFSEIITKNKVTLINNNLIQPTPIIVLDNQNDCLIVGGKWGAIGIGSQELCNLPTSDGGKSCTDSAQCEGMCLVEKTSGKCTSWKITVGCVTEMRNGKIGSQICID